jgi:DNA polymerase III subunit beta
MTPIDTQHETAIERFMSALPYSGNLALAKVIEATELCDSTPEGEMKFSLQQDVLLETIKLAMKSASPRSTLPILGNVLLVAHQNQITVTSTNFSTGISLCIPAEVEHDGAFTIPAKPLLECIKTFPKGKRVTIEVNERVVVTCGTRTFALKGGTVANEFPKLWGELIPGPGSPCVINSTLLRQAIKEVESFADEDDSERPVFESVCLHVRPDQLDLIAADRFRFAARTIRQVTTPADCDEVILVPVGAMHFLCEAIPQGDAPVVIAWDDKRSRIIFQTGSIQVTARLICGTFPNHEEHIPQAHQTTCTIKHDDLSQALKAFKIFLANNILRISILSSGSVLLKAKDEDLGDATERIKAEVTGDDAEIIFNGQQLADILKVKAPAYTFFVPENVAQAAAIRPTERDDCLFVLMLMH